MKLKCANCDMEFEASASQEKKIRRKNHRFTCSDSCKNILIADDRRAQVKHGDCRRDIEAPEYRAWRSMVDRCTNPNFHHFENYGGRGIKVCDSWLNDYSMFLKDVGRKPSPKHSLDRYPNNNGNYEPGNVRWATGKEQQRNKRNNNLITADGITLTLSDWSLKTGIFRSVVDNRLKRGWSVEQALGLVAKPTRFIRGKSPYRGVSFDPRYKKPWEAKVYDHITRKGIVVGRFDSEVDAAAAYNFAAMEIVGDESLLNLPLPL